VRNARPSRIAGKAFRWEQKMDDNMSAAGTALAAWTVLHVLLAHLRDTGVLTDEARRGLLERALEVCESLDQAPDQKVLTDARRILEEWL
jgi:hypothetical protein